MASAARVVFKIDERLVMTESGRFHLEHELGIFVWKDSTTKMSWSRMFRLTEEQHTKARLTIYEVMTKQQVRDAKSEISTIDEG